MPRLSYELEDAVTLQSLLDENHDELENLFGRMAELLSKPGDTVERITISLHNCPGIGITWER